MTGTSAKKRLFSIAAVRESATASINASASGDGVPLLLTVIASTRRRFSLRVLVGFPVLGRGHRQILVGNQLLQELKRRPT